MRGVEDFRMALKIDYEEVLDFGEEAAKDVDEKMKILKFEYNWADVMEEADKQKETKVELIKTRDPQKILKRNHAKRLREIEDRKKHSLGLNQLHKELLEFFNVKNEPKAKRDHQKILKDKHELLLKKIETKRETEKLLISAHEQLLKRIEAKQIRRSLLMNVHNQLLNVMKKEDTVTALSGGRRPLFSTLKVLTDKGTRMTYGILKYFGFI
ncbi:uncharacterized protein LOC133191006 [Saccostrea echinata]|uniref:uncharacterized protein LOC133191006 n=1 Tax=Saccostrea echinata TaxID=191078 RepID=UPI002A7FC7B5|nr:uncharacterized protein LOC133191006 [Saccostrea echinata]